MKKLFSELNLGYSNAENYRRRENKELLAKYFVQDHYLDRVLEPSVYFLIGEKGTGKTAYATFLRNNDYKNHKAWIYDVRQTEYQKFLELKKKEHLVLSQYGDVWQVLLLMSIASSIPSGSGTPDFLKRFTKLNGLKRAIDEFYDNAFAPELVKMLSFVESGELSASLVAKYSGSSAGLEAKKHVEIHDSKTLFQVNLLKIRKAFETAIRALKLDSNYIIFIDGIDVRPGNIAYADYFDCVRGLIEAIWSINNDFLANVKDSGGRIRAVLLVRPDIFLKTGLHNVNTKIRDNSVFLNWMTTYKDYRTSLLFRVADRLLSVQQDAPSKNIGETWDYYFPFHAENVRATKVSSEREVNSFLTFLRFSYYRPRDINSMINTMQDILRRTNPLANYVTAENFDDPTFRDAHAEYLLGEIKDQLLFYYSQAEFDLFMQFFLHLRGKRKFSYSEYIESFNEFIVECQRASKMLPQFFESADVFLQFLYEQNVICYMEHDVSHRGDSERFVRWCFRERTLSNMAPKVRAGVNYEIFYGLSKALNVGRQVRSSKKESRRLIGTVVRIRGEEGFGFIRGGDAHDDYYFKFEEFDSVDDKGIAISQKVSFEVTVKYGRPRAIRIKKIR